MEGQISEKKESALTIFKNFVEDDAVIERFKNVLGDASARPFIQGVILAVANSDHLQQCTPVSIANAAMRAALLRLAVSPEVGHAYIVPFKNKGRYTATMIPGYKGLYQMALRTEKYRWINVADIREGEQVVEDKLSGITRIEGRAAGPDAPVIGYLAAFELFTGYSKALYMTLKEIHNHAARYSPSYGSDYGPWKDHREAMERKTVLRQLLTHWGYLDPLDTMRMDGDGSEWQESDFDMSLYDRPRRRKITAREVINELGFDDPVDATVQDHEPEFDEPEFDEPEAPAPVFQEAPAYRSAEEVKAYVDETAPKFQGTTISNNQRGILITAIENAVRGKDNRYQVTKYLTGHVHMNDVPAEKIAALYAYVNPEKDSGGQWLACAEAEKELNIVLLATNPAQVGRFQK